jgi:hypothetical protein
MNAFTFECILVLYHLVKRKSKRGMLLICYSHIHFSFSALKCPHVLGLGTYVYMGRRVEELCTCIWFCECINNELDDSSS